MKKEGTCLSESGFAGFWDEQDIHTAKHAGTKQLHMPLLTSRCLPDPRASDAESACCAATKTLAGLGDTVKSSVFPSSCSS